MTVTVDWVDQDQTLIYMVAKGRLSPDEVLTSAEILWRMVSSVSHPVEVIIDANRQVFFSNRYVEMLHIVHQRHFPNLRMVVFVGDSLVWELFLTFARQFGKLPYQFAMRPSFKEARDLIQNFRLDASAPPTSSSRWN